MKFIRQGATHKVVLGPAVAVGDGFTPVTTLALTTADEAEAILHDNGTIVDISGYTWAAIATADGYYHLTLQSGISNTVGHLSIVVNDDSLCLPLREDFMVLEEAVYDAMFASSAPGYVANAPVNAAQIGGQNVGLSSDNRLRVDVAEWNDIPLATTNPLPNAAPDAAGGLPISDAGGLDLDVKLANTNEVTAARMGALTDWIDGGRLDLLIDAIKAKTDSLTFTVAGVLDANTMRISGTVQTAGDVSAQLSTLLVRLSNARAGYLDNLNIDIATAEDVIGVYDIVSSLTYGNAALKTLIDAKASQTSVDDLPTNAELATALAAADDAVLAAIAALSIPTTSQITTAVWTTALTEAYRATGAAGTAAQYIHELIAHLGESAISGTTKTLKKLDGSTTAKTYTLDDATTPTSITEAT